MKVGNQIALTYSALISGVIVLVCTLFFIIASVYMKRMTADPELVRTLQVGLGIMMLGVICICSLLVYFIGKHYANRMIDRIDTAYQSEKAFVRSASHELNNPLTAIQGECEITLMKERTPMEYQISLSRILTETQRIIQLMKQLLFLSRGDQDILQNTTESVLLAEFMMRFVDRDVEFSPDNFSFVVNANPHLLKIAIENILGNARKYSGGQRVCITLRGSELAIEDKGIGIPPEELEHIFQPFFRASNTREYAGHGIGLALSLKILQSYGAKIIVESEVNKGTRVRIIFL